MSKEKQIDNWLQSIDKKDADVLQDDLQNNRDEVEDAFSATLSFGTGGLRGLIGLGPNRMNIYTVAQATQGLSNYLLSRYHQPSVIICRDSRKMGQEFVEAAATVLVANGIKTLIFPRPEPTPLLSFAVRFFRCSAGINITASHNPATYNGYKVYGHDGCQITDQIACSIQNEIQNTDIFTGVQRIDFNLALKSGLITWVADKIINAFISEIVNLNEEISRIRGHINLVYTPLNGAGLECMSKLLSKLDIDSYSIVSEQANPDGDFPTCPYPNPEVPDALQLGLRLCHELHPDLLLATDPDADRVGIAVPHDGEFKLLSGNEVGILLLDWLCKLHVQSQKVLSNKIVVSTVVSSVLAEKLAEKYDFELRKTLTGFKYIGEQITILEEKGELDRFLFGFEESCGYLAGTHARDKDAILASMLICQMARWYKKQGISIYDALDAIYREYGYYYTELISVPSSRNYSANKLNTIAAVLQKGNLLQSSGLKIIEVIDYSKGKEMPITSSHGGKQEQTLRPSNVLEIKLEHENKIIIRPSGTEPKTKAYLFVKGKDEQDARNILSALSEDTHKLLN